MDGLCESFSDLCDCIYSVKLYLEGCTVVSCLYSGLSKAELVMCLLKERVKLSNLLDYIFGRCVLVLSEDTLEGLRSKYFPFILLITI